MCRRKSRPQYSLAFGCGFVPASTMVLLCSSHSLTPGFLPFLLFFYSQTLRPFNIILNIVFLPVVTLMLISIIIVGNLILIFIIIPINLTSTISIAEFLELLLPVYNPAPSSGSLRLLLLLLLPSLPLQFSI